jgi:hypothetical protein
VVIYQRIGQGRGRICTTPKHTVVVFQCLVILQFRICDRRRHSLALAVAETAGRTVYILSAAVFTALLVSTSLPQVSSRELVVFPPSGGRGVATKSRKAWPTFARASLSEIST